jgi:hypothetical protein
MREASELAREHVALHNQQRRDMLAHALHRGKLEDHRRRLHEHLARLKRQHAERHAR